jgi:nucleotide-binding universal stress UspA family protein
MDISAIMVHVDASQSVEARLCHAVALAGSFNATLIGLLSLSADEPAWVYRTADGRRERQAYEPDLGAACEAARKPSTSPPKPRRLPLTGASARARPPTPSSAKAGWPTC